MLTDEQLAERIGPRLRGELAVIAPPAGLLATLRRRHARRARATRTAKIAALPLAATAAAVAVTMTSLSPAPSGSVITVRELAYRAAAAAAAQPYLRPGQWVRWTERVAGGPPGALRERTIQQWSTADARKFVMFSATGTPLVAPSTCLNPKDERRLAICPGNHEWAPPSNGWSLGFGWGWTLPVSYAGLGTLPRRPLALDAHLASLHESGGWVQPVTRSFASGSRHTAAASTEYGGSFVAGWRPPAPFREFVIIEQLLATYVMPPRLTAELYRAIAGIPGVTISTHAVDVASRPGVSFTMKVPDAAGGGTNQIVFNPHTYQLMGQQAIGIWPAHTRILAGTAILGESPVSGPGAQH